MPEDRIARRNRGSPRGLWLLVALALAAGLLVIAAMLKSSAADQKARRELDAVASDAGAPAPARTGTADQRM
ncbi:MAG TPA: hypothetical protein VN018_02020 [Brevundimonas sp.]|nr:hypothetical protein [Brevundimonas sp.]